MTREPSIWEAAAEDAGARSITGVASGGLGTGTNLDETQVFSTEELRAAALPPPESSPRPKPEPPSVAGSVNSDSSPGNAAVGPTRRLPFLAGAVVLVILVAVAGYGMISQLDLGAAAAPGPISSPSTVGQTAAPGATPSAPRQEAGRGGAIGGNRGNKGCHGNGHGNGCGGRAAD